MRIIRPHLSCSPSRPSCVCNCYLLLLSHASLWEPERFLRCIRSSHIPRQKDALVSVDCSTQEMPPGMLGTAKDLTGASGYVYTTTVSPKTEKFSLCVLKNICIYTTSCEKDPHLHRSAKIIEDAVVCMPGQ